MNPPGDDTRVRIVQEALRLFGDNGYHATSMSQVVEATGLTKGGVYFHFSSKAALADAVIAVAKEAVDGRVAASIQGVSVLDDITAVIDAAFEVWGTPEQSLLFRLSAEQNGPTPTEFTLESPVRRWSVIVQDLLERGMREGALSPNLDAPGIAAVLVAAYFALSDALGPDANALSEVKGTYIAVVGAALGITLPGSSGRAGLVPPSSNPGSRSATPGRKTS